MRVPADLSAEALAKADALAKVGCSGGFRAPSPKRLWRVGDRSSDGRHGCEAVGLHNQGDGGVRTREGPHRIRVGAVGRGFMAPGIF